MYSDVLHQLRLLTLTSFKLIRNTVHILGNFHSFSNLISQAFLTWLAASVPWMSVSPVSPVLSSNWFLLSPPAFSSYDHIMNTHKNKPILLSRIAIQIYLIQISRERPGNENNCASYSMFGWRRCFRIDMFRIVWLLRGRLGNCCFKFFSPGIPWCFVYFQPTFLCTGIYINKPIFFLYNTYYQESSMFLMVTFRKEQA